MVDVVVANGAIHSAQGLLDPFWQTKKGGLSLAQFAMFNGTSCVLLDIPEDRRVFTSGETLAVDFLFAHYGDADLQDATLEWSLELGGSCLSRPDGDGRDKRVPPVADAINCVPPVCRRIPIGDIAIGPARKIASAQIVMPSVAKAVKVVLRAEVAGTVNNWDFWVFPERAKRDGADIAADVALLPLLARHYDGVVDAALPAGASARVVIAPYGSKTAADALARGQNVLTVSGWDGRPNVSLGWWSMGSQVGMALAQGNPALAGLPHEGALTPLLFRVVKEGAYGLSRRELTGTVPIVVGEGKKDCYLYLGEVKAAGDSRSPKTAKGRHMAAFGLDLFSELPECRALIDGIVDVLRSRSLAGKD